MSYWIRFHISECALCGKSDNWQERMPLPRPKDDNKRYVQESQWACDDHFL